MKRKSLLKRLVSSVIIMVMMLTMLPDAMPTKVSAAASSKNLASTYFNATTKYLHLGDEGAGSFNFNIKKEAKKPGATYTWYVKADKGNPNAVTINRKNGIVTAKEAGTAYIRCKITFADGTYIRPEAKVTVRNNITGVKINNLPDDMTISVGTTYDFNRTILNTKAGKGKKTGGITRWEIQDDTAGVVSASDKGIVYPVQSGEFNIRAVSFQSKAKHNSWLEDKEINKKFITASSDWHTIMVESSDGQAIANTQEQLNKALLSDEITDIALSSEKGVLFTIEEGDYSTKSLTVDTPKADIENHGVFKEITIKDIKDTTWIEYADGNIVYLLDDNLTFVIDKDAKIKRIVVDTPNSVVNFEIHGQVDMISVLQPSQINLSGDSKNVPISIEENAEGSKIASSVSMDLTLNANTEIILDKGAEETKIDKSASNVKVQIENKSEKDIVITTNKANPETIESGAKGTSSEETVPTPVPSPGGGGGYTPPVPTPTPTPKPEPTTVPVDSVEISGANTVEVGKTITLTAKVMPEEATEKRVTWLSKNEDIATVDIDKGLVTVTGVATGSAIILVTTVDGDKTDKHEVKVVDIGEDPEVLVSAININKSTTTLVEGTTETLTVTFTPSNASNKTITWTTSDASKATIDSTGKVRAVSAGTATITAKSNNGKTATCVVTVTTTLVPVSAITVTGDGPVVNGKTLQMGVDITPTTATNKKVTWSVINGTGSATISSSGLLKGTKVGTVTVKAAAQDGSGKEDTKEITIHADLTAYNAALAAVKEADYTTDSWNAYQVVVAANVATDTDKQADVDAATLAITNAQADLIIPVKSIEITGDGSVAKDDTLQLTAIITPDNATNPDVTWSIETGGTGSATISEDGLLNPTSEGTVTVKVVSQYDVSITATKKITVTASKLDAAKANAKSELDTYVDATDYAINNATELATAISDGKTAIDGASDIAGVNTALANAKVAIDAIKTDAEIAAEELATAKESAKTELENYKVAANYTRNAAALSTAIENGKTAIDNATDIAGVNTALANAKTIINAIKSDKDLDDDDIATAKTNIEGESYTATQAEVSDAGVALSKAQALVNALELKGTTATVVAGTLTEAVAGDSSTPEGKNGLYTFTVTIAKGSGTQKTTTVQKMTITATPYDSTAQDNADIESAKTNIESAAYTATQAEASDSAKALTKAQALVEALELKGTTATVVAGTFVEAITGTEDYVNGTNGSFSFTVEISKDKGTTLTTVEKTMTITATKYDPTADNADIAAAKAKIESAAYTATQAEVSDASAAKTKVETIISGLDTAETIVDVVPGSFSGAIAGVDGVFAATDGSYTFTVKINKGGGTEAITTELTLTITAETTTVTKASTVKVNGEKTLDSSNPFLVDGEPAATGTLGSAGCTAHFDSSTGVLTLQGYNGAGIGNLFAIKPDLVIKLIGDNVITSSGDGISNSDSGNIYITSVNDATLKVESTSTNQVAAITTNTSSSSYAGSIIIGGKAKVTVSSETTGENNMAMGLNAKDDIIIQGNASFIVQSIKPKNNGYGILANKRIVIDTTGKIDIDCSDSSKNDALYGINGVDIKNVTLMTLNKATTGSFIVGSQNLSRVAVNIKDNIATYRGGTPYELKVLNGQITAVQEGQIGVPYQGLENDEITIKANTIANFKFVKWTNGDGTDIDSSVVFLEGNVNSSEAKIKMPAKDLNIKAEYKSTIFAEQPSFHRGEKKIKWNVGEATFSGSGDSFKLQEKPDGVWKVKTHPFINSTDAKNGYIEVNNNSSNHTTYTPDGNYRLYFKVDGKDHYSEEFVVQWEDTINIAAIPGVTAPVTGETPVDTITETDQYTGTVTWTPTATKFAGDTAYTATITLKAKDGYKLDGVAANYFTVAGADTVTNAVDSGVITAVFPKTGAALSGDATLTSTMGTVDNSAETIVDIPNATTLVDFKAAITPATGATYEVYEADGITVATGLATDYKVIVTAEDTTTTKTYTVKFSDFAGGTGTLGDPYEVATAEQLNKVRNYLDKHFIQTANIDLSTYNTDGGWQPIGDSTTPFKGTYDGDSKDITGLFINREADYQGLFGSTASAKVENCRISGSVTGKNSVGGLVGYNYSGTISKSYSSVAVQGVNSVGGLVGSNRGPGDETDNGRIENSYASGTVTGEKFTGGLVGICQEGNITNSYATGFVTGGESNKGGLTGAKYTSSVITSSYYDIETTNQPVVSGNPTGIGKTTAEMKQADTFVGWDFENIWTIVEDSYPKLK